MEILGGPYFGVAGAGESHGPAVVTTIFGCPPGLWVERAVVQAFLDRRRPGSTKHGTPRQEADRVVFLSGLFQNDIDALTAGPELSLASHDKPQATSSYEAGHTTGEPISALVLSTSGKSRHYEQFQGPQGEVRPGHTDLVKHYQSGGYVDFRGGGRSSYRSTISDVVGGSIARLYLEETFGTVILSSVSQVGELRAAESLAEAVAELPQRLTAEMIAALATVINANWDATGIPTLDSTFATAAGELIKATRVAGDSIGAVVEVVALNVPALAGEPLYNSLKVRLMGTLGGLHAAQGVEIGAGAAVAERTGSVNNDPIRSEGYQRNSHGGLLGGITTGNPLVARVAFKPTSSIARPQQSVRKDLSEVEFELRKGRHDPCVGVRAGITLESRLAVELLNAVLAHAARHVQPSSFRLFSDPTDQ